MLCAINAMCRTEQGEGVVFGFDAGYRNEKAMVL
jgi:hypothetical protein